jgi:hypothetical protein
MMPDDVDGMTLFATVAEAKSVREPGDRLGVSASAVSQAVRTLEERVGVALLQRTTRSVRSPARELGVRQRARYLYWFAARRWGRDYRAFSGMVGVTLARHLHHRPPEAHARTRSTSACRT